MPKVSVEDLKPGMKLAKPLSRGNMVLLGEGTVLNETWIARIGDMGIEAIFVEGPSEQPVPKEEAIRQLDERFRNVLSQPYMNRIKKMVKEHIEGLYV
ncbi:MAG: hypothetical protein M1418_07100 [Deltaproteobacteria bacterium]|nr:hypothetical protein [Deltaproteobacteria bacterium]